MLIGPVFGVENGLQECIVPQVTAFEGVPPERQAILAHLGAAFTSYTVCARGGQAVDRRQPPNVSDDNSEVFPGVNWLSASGSG